MIKYFFLSSSISVPAYFVNRTTSPTSISISTVLPSCGEKIPGPLATTLALFGNSFAESGIMIPLLVTSSFF